MTMIKNRIGEIGCADDFGEALAYAVYCVRADRFPHPDNEGKHAVAHMDMLRAGWTEEQLQDIAKMAVKHGTYQVEAELYARAITKGKRAGV